VDELRLFFLLLLFSFPPPVFLIPLPLMQIDYFLYRLGSGSSEEKRKLGKKTQHEKTRRKKENAKKT
jgi:hypothetical protein